MWNWNLEVTLQLLDFEITFDFVEWIGLFKVLNKFISGNYLIKWIKIMYTKPILQMKKKLVAEILAIRKQQQQITALTVLW